MTVKETRRKLFKRNIERVREFFSLSKMEFNKIFIDGESDGCLRGTLERAGHTIQVMICRNGHEPEIFCMKNRIVERDLNQAYQDVFKNRD